MPGDPINLNLARIVHRIMTSPRGWRVSQIQQELGIAPRTYRKYRRILQEEFLPFRRRDGTPALEEYVDGEERYLRLRPIREFSAADRGLELHAAALRFAASLLISTGTPELVEAGRNVLDDLSASLRDRDFLLASALANFDRKFRTELPTPNAATHFPKLVRAVAQNRRIDLESDLVSGRVSPLSIILRPDDFVCVVLHDDEMMEIPSCAISALEVLEETFAYPSTVRYPP